MTQNRITGSIINNIKRVLSQSPEVELYVRKWLELSEFVNRSLVGAAYSSFFVIHTSFSSKVWSTTVLSIDPGIRPLTLNVRENIESGGKDRWLVALLFSSVAKVNKSINSENNIFENKIRFYFFAADEKNNPEQKYTEIWYDSRERNYKNLILNNNWKI